MAHPLALSLWTFPQNRAFLRVFPRPHTESNRQNGKKKYPTFILQTGRISLIPRETRNEQLFNFTPKVNRVEQIATSASRFNLQWYFVYSMITYILRFLFVFDFTSCHLIGYRSSKRNRYFSWLPEAGLSRLGPFGEENSNSFFKNSFVVALPVVDWMMFFISYTVIMLSFNEAILNDANAFTSQWRHNHTIRIA